MAGVQAQQLRIMTSAIRTHSSPDRQSADIENPGCIYLDHAATSPLDSRVLELMVSIMSKTVIGNAHSTHHPYGAAADLIVRKAREHVATAIGAQANEIVFTSGATESNNLAIKGIAGYLKSVKKTRIITSAIEHMSILAPLSQLEREGFEIVRLRPRPCGMITADIMERALDEHTGLVTLQAVNNELGTIQPLSKISEILRRHQILFHSDAAQALGKISLSLHSEQLDFASFSAHKIGGPQGVGCLYVRAEHRSHLDALLAGGGQERGTRSGSTPVALCAGFGKACSLIEPSQQRLWDARQFFLAQIEELQPVVHGHREPHGNVAGIVSIRFPGIDNDTLIMSLPGLAFGVGSACTKSGDKLSHVVQAVSDDEQAPAETIRISFGSSTTLQELEAAAKQIVRAVTEIRQIQQVT